MSLVYYNNANIFTHKLSSETCPFMHVDCQQILIAYNNPMSVQHFLPQIIIMAGISITAFVSAKLSFIFLYIDLVPYCIWDCNIPIGLLFAKVPNRLINYLMFFIFFKKFSCKTFLQPIFAQKMVLPFCYEDFHITIQHVHNFIYVAC